MASSSSSSRRELRRLSLAAVALAVAWVALLAQTPSVDDLFRDFGAEWIRRNPNLATSTRYFTGAEQTRLEQQLTPETVEFDRGTIRLARRGLEDLARFDQARMSDAQRLSADVMRWQLEVLVEGEPYLDYVFPLEQNNGANIRIPNALTVVHPLQTPTDAENYVERLRQVDDRMAEAVAGAERLAREAILPPRFILRATITQMRRFIEPRPADNPFVTAFTQRSGGIAALPAARRRQLTADAARVVETEVYPAWQKAIAVLEAQVSQATDDAGLWRFTGGAEIYAQRLRTNTTTRLTADRIHEIGLREVARIESEMEAILRKLGYADGSIASRVEKLKSTLGYPDSDEGRARIMADIDDIMRDALQRSAALFDAMPKSPVIAQPYPRFRWANAAASYTAAPQDGSRPAVFQMPLRLEQMTKFRLRSLVYHETVPGHHFQIALGQENPSLPRFRQVRSFGGMAATSEGWALYAEQLAAESGWYDGDLEGQLGQLDAALFRARRLVVDTGLHAKRWTRQQAIDYGIEASEVERYVVNPGQACAYMVGQLKIVELRERARAALGDRFSLKAFHNVVLDLGVVPLDVMERAVDAYIAAARGTR